MSFKDLPAEARPREKLLARGAAALGDAELLALLLRTGMAGKNVLQLAQELLDTFGGIAGLLQTGVEDLRQVKGLGGPAKRAELTAVLEHTVVGTIQLLADHGYWQFGIVVLVAGIAIPIFELACLMWLLARVRFPAQKGLVLRTRLYRLMHRLVRWPMIIPFIAALAAPIVDFRGVDDIVAGPGATPLFLLIALIMLAIRLFEPRHMWKTAGVAR